MPSNAVYEIHVKEILDHKWEATFSPLHLVAMHNETLIRGPLPDQAALFGVLIKMRDLGLQLISVHSSPEQDKQTAQVQAVFPILSSERLLLREFSVEDAPAVFDIFSQPEVVQWVELSQFESLTRAEELVRVRMRLFHERLGCRWAIALREAPQQVIGSCGYFHLRKGTHTWEIGYDLHPAYWRQGLMSEALQTMMHFTLSAGNPFPVHRLEALVAPRNAASIHLLEKFGFEKECLRREFGLWNHRYQDVYLYALLNPNREIAINS